MRKVYVILFLLFSYIAIYGQCGLSGNFKVEDQNNSAADTTNLQLVVNNALNNNLASASQGVCGVFIKFRHPFQKELFIELVSPDGKVVTLVGGNVTAYNTPFITWDVGFVGCSMTASPDIGFTDQWENDQDWQSFSTYNGQYYPNTGCLEDFNIGQVNGTWTLRCIDFVDFGEGVVLDFKIVFCNQAGIMCEACKTVANTILNQDFSSCERNDNLKFTINAQLDSTLIDTTNYIYTHIVFSNGKIIYIGDDIDLRNSPPSDYQIYTLQYAKIIENLLPKVGDDFSSVSYRTYLFGRGFCASISGERLNIFISPSIPSVALNQKICKGQTFKVGTEVYDKAGRYEVVIKKQFCDSIIDLNLEVIDLMAAIESDRDSISCLKNSNALQLMTSNGAITSESFQWFTDDGNIRTSPTESIIDISSAGNYCVRYSGIEQGLMCVDTICKEIFLDITNPILTFTSDVITCKLDSVLVEISSNIPIVSTTWTSLEGNTFVSRGQNIMVGSPGNYLVSIVADNGCSTSQNIVIKIDTATVLPNFEVDTFRCTTDSLQLITLLKPQDSISIKWQNVDPRYLKELNPFLLAPGPITANITNLRNGCNRLVDILVPATTDKPLITDLLFNTLTCVDSVTSIQILSPSTIATYSWLGVGFSSDLPSPSVSQGGDYAVTITEAITGCEVDTSFTILLNKVPAIVDFSADTITCIVDSVVINFVSDIGLTQLNWTGPGNFVSNMANPKVTEVGTYVVQYESSNGCIGSSTIEILGSKDLPTPDIVMPPITCVNDTISPIITNAPPHVSYIWTGTNIINPTTDNPSFVQAGVYEVTITDTISFCTYIIKLNVTDDRVFSELMINEPTIICNTDSTQIIISNPEVTSMIITGPDGYLSTNINPFVKEPGKYYITATNQRLCTTQDSVTVIQNDLNPTVSATYLPITCAKPEAAITAISDLANTVFSWIKPDGDITTGNSLITTTPGQFILSGTAPNGCSSQISIDVMMDTISPQATVLLPIDTITCQQKEISLSINTSLDNSVTWNSFPQGQNTILVRDPGTYLAEITAANGCKTAKSAVVSEDRQTPQITASATEINCIDLLSLIEILSDNSMDEIRWDNVTNPTTIPDGSFTYSTSFPGIYNFVVVNKEGCEKDSTIVLIANNSKPMVTSIISDSITCLNQKVTIGVVLASNGIEFTWNGPNVSDLVADSSIKVSEEGRYFVLITGDNFCKKDTFIDVVRNDQIPRITTFSDTLTCNKGKITIGVNINPDIIKYQWQGPAFVNNVRNPIISVPGLYTVTATAGNDCAAVATINVLQDILKPTFEIRDTFFLPCDTSLIQLVINEINSIDRLKWIFPDNTVRNQKNPTTTTIGNYSVQATGVNGCLGDVVEFKVLINNKALEYKTITDTITCNSKLVTLNVSVDTTITDFHWISPSLINYFTQSINTNENGTFRLILTNKARCTDTSIVLVPIDTIVPEIMLSSVGQIKCAEKEVELTANFIDNPSIYGYMWKTIDGEINGDSQATTIKIEKIGNYSFELLNTRNGCINTQSLNIIKQPQDFNNVRIDRYDPPCSGIFDGRFTLSELDGSPPYTVAVNGIQYDQKLVFNNLKPDEYVVIIIDSLGCEIERTITIDDSSDSDITIQGEFIIDFGDSITLIPNYTKDSTGQSTLIWKSLGQVICNGCDSLTVSPYENKLYIITKNISERCVKTVSVLVRVRKNIKSAIPNVMSVNSTTGNDLFYIAQTRGIEKVVQMDIFDKWAENVFHLVNAVPGDSSVGWNGTFANQVVETGVYVVITQLLLSNGENVKIVSDLTVLK